MTHYLLDTNIVSFFVKRRYPALDSRIKAIPRSRIAVSAVVEAELRLGLSHLPVEARTRMLVEGFLGSVNIYPWDSACATRYASMAATQKRLGRPLATADAMIAAHALALDLVLVSNDAVFQQVEGLAIEDWTKGPQSA